MTVGQINQVTALSPVLEPLLTQAIASQADLSQAERRTVTKYSRPLISSVHQFSLQDIALQLS